MQDPRFRTEQASTATCQASTPATCQASTWFTWMIGHTCHTVDGSEIRRSPVHTCQVVIAGFLNHQQ